jgi:hypothetical protein
MATEELLYGTGAKTYKRDPVNCASGETVVFSLIEHTQFQEGRTIDTAEVVKFALNVATNVPSRLVVLNVANTEAVQHEIDKGNISYTALSDEIAKSVRCEVVVDTFNDEKAACGSTIFHGIVKGGKWKTKRPGDLRLNDNPTVQGDLVCVVLFCNADTVHRVAEANFSIVARRGWTMVASNGAAVPPTDFLDQGQSKKKNRVQERSSGKRNRLW